MKLSFSNRLSFLILLFLSSFLILSESIAQKSDEGNKIKGSVVSADGQIIKGASILIKGSTSGTATDLEGNFALTVPSTDAMLVVTFIDFETKEVLVGEKTEFKITLKSEAGFKLSDQGFMVHSLVDEVPKPSVGMDGWNRYMSKNVNYPQSAREANSQGTVIVGFSVKEDGLISNVEVIRGIGSECDQEAVRVIAEGPAWQPGKIGDESVTTQVSLPIRFAMAVDPGVSATPQQRNEKAIADKFGKHVIVIGYQAK